MLFGLIFNIAFASMTVIIRTCKQQLQNCSHASRDLILVVVVLK